MQTKRPGIWSINITLDMLLTNRVGNSVARVWDALRPDGAPCLPAMNAQSTAHTAEFNLDHISSLWTQNIINKEKSLAD